MLRIAPSRGPALAGARWAVGQGSSFDIPFLRSLVVIVVAAVVIAVVVIIAATATAALEKLTGLGVEVGMRLHEPQVRRCNTCRRARIDILLQAPFLTIIERLGVVLAPLGAAASSSASTALGDVLAIVVIVLLFLFIVAVLFDVLNIIVILPSALGTTAFGLIRRGGVAVVVAAVYLRWGSEAHGRCCEHPGRLNVALASRRLDQPMRGHPAHCALAGTPPGA